MKSVVFFLFSLATVGLAVEFQAAGKVNCKLDGATGHTEGIVQLWEHDIDPNDFMAQTHLKDNKFSGLNFSESEITGEVEPYLIAYHDCHKDLRPADGVPLKEGCRALSRYYFSPPQGSNKIWIEFNLESTIESELKCDGAKAFASTAAPTDKKTVKTVVKSSESKSAGD